MHAATLTMPVLANGSSALPCLALRAALDGGSAVIALVETDDPMAE